MSNKNEELFQAIRDDKPVAKIIQLIEEGAEVVCWDDEEQSPLHVAAAKSSDPEIISELIERGADPNCSGPEHDEDEGFQWEPIRCAIFNEVNPAQIISALVRGGALPDLPDEVGRTPLFEAVKYRKLEAIRALVAAGADASAKFRPTMTSPWELVRGTFTPESDVFATLSEAVNQKLERDSRDEPPAIEQLIANVSQIRRDSLPGHCIESRLLPPINDVIESYVGLCNALNQLENEIDYIGWLGPDEIHPRTLYLEPIVNEVERELRPKILEVISTFNAAANIAEGNYDF